MQLPAMRIALRISFRFFMSLSLSYESLFKQRAVEQSDHRRPGQHDEGRRENKQHQREAHLDRGLRRGFFGGGLTLTAKRVGMNAQRLGDARAESIGLNQHRRKLHESRTAGAIAEV